MVFEPTLGLRRRVPMACHNREDRMFRSILSFGSVLVLALAACLLVTPNILAQSTASITGTVTDATGAVIPNATVTVRNQNTGEERTMQTDSAGIYAVPSLPVGTYRVEVKSSGMQTTAAPNLVLNVGTTVRQDFSLKVAATTETIEITAAAPVVQGSTVSVGSVVNQTTVQEIPLNGRHFIDLTLLTAGTVTPPANGFLTAPLRGQGLIRLQQRRRARRRSQLHDQRRQSQRPGAESNHLPADHQYGIRIQAGQFHLQR